MRSFRLMALLAMCLMLLAAPVQAKTTITFWHGMGGELGEITDDLIKEFNASQDQYEVKGVYKGNYDEAMTAAIAATRCEKPITLLGSQCVKKSYPNFWEDYEALGGRLTRR